MIEETIGSCFVSLFRKTKWRSWMWNIPSYEWQSHIQKLAGYTLEVKVSQVYA